MLQFSKYKVFKKMAILHRRINKTKKIPKITMYLDHAQLLTDLSRYTTVYETILILYIDSLVKLKLFK